MKKHRPDLFVHTLNNLRNGSAAEQLSEKLHACIVAAKETGKIATLKVELKIKPDGPDGKIMFLSEVATAKIPELDKAVTLMFATDNGELTRQDPNQGVLPLRSVDDDDQPIRQTGNE